MMMYSAPIGFSLAFELQAKTFGTGVLSLFITYHWELDTQVKSVERYEACLLTKSIVATSLAVV